jgi:hypothetical protein
MAMDEKIAKRTIEDHKYLLESVDNRAAIAYFAVANRNYCLFAALKSFLDQNKEEMEKIKKKNEKKDALAGGETGRSLEKGRSMYQNKKEIE